MDHLVVNENVEDTKQGYLQSKVKCEINQPDRQLWGTATALTQEHITLLQQIQTYEIHI